MASNSTPNSLRVGGMGPGAIETLDGAHWQQFEKIAPAIRSMQSTAMTQDQAGVLSRSRQKFRHPFRRATGKPRDALDQVSEHFVQVLQGRVEGAVVSPVAL